LVRVKDVFKFIAHQNLKINPDMKVFSSRRGLKNPFTAFNKLRNEILNIEPKIIYESIRQYCVVNKISQNNNLSRYEIYENTLMLDSYESLVNVVWNFLQIQVEINALNFANLIEEIKETEIKRNIWS
jgi:hypothetical protein